LSTVAVPIELIANALELSTSRAVCAEPFSATMRRTSKGYEISHGSNQHYYRKRFNLAHEIGHILLSRLAGPLNNKDLFSTKGQSYEEETICDLFASALLLPEGAMREVLSGKVVTERDVTLLAKRFQVSRGAVLRRIALLNDSTLILWDFMVNPLKAKSKKAERIAQVYPFVSQLSKHFIPLYCTLLSARFSPNMLLESFQTGQGLSGYVRIDKLGTLKCADYFVHNIPFQKWNENMLEPEIVRKPRQFFNMATFIHPPH
jgi:Zn-dependent peptidase ImmA (M78 family)